MSSIYAALVAALVYLIIVFIEDGFLSWDCLTRPIVVAPLTGLLLGDFHTGVVMGASLEAIFMGIFAIGGSLPANATAGSSIAVAYVILTGSSRRQDWLLLFRLERLLHLSARWFSLSVRHWLPIGKNWHWKRNIQNL